MGLEVNESARDKDGKYIVKKKVKVDEIEFLSEVPKHWPVPPEDTEMAYVLDLDKDKRWHDLAMGNKKILLDHSLKQEAQPNVSLHD